MGFSLKKTFKKVSKAVTKTAKSFVNAGTDAVKSAARGDLGGLADAATRAATGGTISLGDKGGVLNANLTNQPKQTSDVPVATATEDADLLAYVNNLRSRKSRRSRASTDNTGGAYTDNNKLSNSTPLGV